MRLTRRRLLATSAVLMLLTTILHTYGNLMPTTDARLAAFEGTMRHFILDAGIGMKPSMLDIHMVLVLVMSITFAALGFLNLLLALAPDLPDRLVGLLVRVNLIWVAAFTALCAYYQIPPPLISGVIIELPLIAALLVK